MGDWEVQTRGSADCRRRFYPTLRFVYDCGGCERLDMCSKGSSGRLETHNPIDVKECEQRVLAQRLLRWQCTITGADAGPGGRDREYIFCFWRNKLVIF